MLETHLRQVATVVLESAIRISPPDAREWGLAMRGELSHVEGPWAALMWALGGAGILAARLDGGESRGKAAVERSQHNGTDGQGNGAFDQGKAGGSGRGLGLGGVAV